MCFDFGDLIFLNACSIIMSCLIFPQKVRVLCGLQSSFHHDFTLPFNLQALTVLSSEHFLQLCCGDFFGGGTGGSVCGLVCGFFVVWLCQQNISWLTIIHLRSQALVNGVITAHLVHHVFALEFLKWIKKDILALDNLIECYCTNGVGLEILIG